MKNERHESGEREPKGATSSDRSGQRKGSNAGPNSTKGTKGETGEREPKGAIASDKSGERSGKIVNGVGMGQFDGHCRSGGGKETGEMNSGRSESTVYNHTRKSYQ